MKDVNEFDKDRLSETGRRPAKISNGWEDDEASLESAEEQWCIVSDVNVQSASNKEGIPKGNSWDEPKNPSSSTEPSSDDTMKLSSENLVPPKMKKPKNMLVLLHLLVGVIVVFHLAWDRYSWRNSAIYLEQELRELKTEPVLEQTRLKHDTSHTPLGGGEAGPRGFEFLDQDFVDFDSRDWQQEKEEQPDNVILDNCWVHARASVSFRECAEDAKHTLKEVTTEVVDAAKVIAKRTWKAAKKFKKQAEIVAAEAAARRRNRPY